VNRLRIDHDNCTLCELCIAGCPFEAIEVAGGRIVVNEKCTLCGACLEQCPAGALSIREKRGARRDDTGDFEGVWVFGEVAGGDVHPVVFELIGKGRELADRRGTTLSVILLGASLDMPVAALRGCPLDRIYVVEDPLLARFRSETYAAALAELVEQERPEILLCGATSMGRSFFPRVAALLKTGLTADCTGLDIDEQEGLLLQTRPAFGGNIMATIICPRHRPQMATVRPKVLSPLAQRKGNDVRVVRLAPSAAAVASPVEVLEVCVEQADTARVAEADVIVAGGRGVGSPEGFQVIRDLARALRGAVGASRAAVDAGWMGYQHQVGQTGQTVQPKLYIACGISGAVQHLVGMQSAGTIIAVNKDPRAPIFRVADFGLVGDLHVILPRLTESIARKRGERRP